MSDNKPSNKPTVEMPSKKQLGKLVGPYSDKELELTPEMQEKMNKLMEFFDYYGIDYSKFKPEFVSFITEKKAYPNYDQYQYVAGQHDLKKWMYAIKDIHYKQKAGFPYREAIKRATQGWAKMEVYDFLNWLRFYEEGSHMKYKFAQVWYENGQPGYFLHIKPDAPKESENKPLYDEHAAQEEAARKEEKRQIIEKQRSKIIGRLDSAEKLLRSQEGQEFAGSELENLMEAIYTLKKKVQLVNKLSVSTRLYEDMIVREGNLLKRNGFVKAAEVLYSLAQTPGQAGEGATGTPDGGAVPPAAPPPPPADPSGAPGGLPATVPGSPGNPATESPNHPAIDAFIDNMNEGNKTDADESEDDDDNLEVEDSEETLMVTEAQIAPPVAPGPPPAALEDVPTTDSPPPDRNPPAFVPDAAPKKPAEEETLEVTEEDLPPPGGDDATPAGKDPSGGGNSNLDNKLDATFAQVTMEEIVSELEDIATYYKVREMPRRLARLDMMFSAKGISSYFPNLAEAQNRALEANNYIATRIDDILAKVRGAIASQDMGAKLKQDENKEKQRKQMRKDQENAELEGNSPEGEAGKETPAVELGELGTPPAPPPAAPPAPPAPPKPPAV